MPSRSFLVVITLALSLSTALGANDWSKPCFDGNCAYDLPESGGGSGILKLHASPQALTDITPAAGWVVLDCDPNTLEQDVRLVCEDDHPDAGCRHVFDHAGPVNKVVRLPESCGHGPFARIVQMNLATDQNLPAHVEGKIKKRDGGAPQVHVMKIDSNFAAIDHTQLGRVQFAFVGSTVPGLDLNDAMADAWWDDAAAWIKTTAAKVGKAITDGAKWVADRVQDLTNMIKDKSHFELKPTVYSSNVSTSATVDLTQPLSIGKCPIGKVGVKVTTSGWLQAKAGVVIIGSVVPPMIDDLAAFGGLDGEITANLKFQLLLQGGFTVTKDKIISDIGLPGLSIPGVITIGPYISMDGRVQGHVELDVNVELDLKYALNRVELWYPKERASSMYRQRGIKSRDSDLTISAAASISAKGFVQGTLTPKINLGFSVASGMATASLYVGADAWLRGTISAIADVSASNKRALAIDEGGAASSSKLRYPRGLKKRNNDVDANFRGCFWIDTGLVLKGGGQGQFMKWKAEKDFTIWASPDWELFRKCWSLGTKTRSMVNSKPKWTLDDIDKLSKAKKDCPTGKKSTGKVTDKVPGKDLSS